MSRRRDFSPRSSSGDWQLDGIPIAVVRGLNVAGEGTAADLVLPPERDLFR